MTARPAIVGVWLLVLAACGAWIHHGLSVTTDLTVFLPPSATPTQRVLMAQLREGVTSRLMLIALQGTDARSLAEASGELAARLGTSGVFAYVNNGDPVLTRKERALLFGRRYVLSPGVDAARFSAAGLEAALRENLSLLASPAGALIRPTLPQDPTGELARIGSMIAPVTGPQLVHGVWFSRDGTRALLVAETRAPGFDVEGQQLAIRAVHDALDAGHVRGVRVALAGPGVFASDMRETIEADAWRLSILTTVLVLAILLAVYRSPLAVGASTLPVVSGLLVGVTAVGLMFGKVHGITLGFGATLIGEAVDYPSYLYLQKAAGETLSATLARIGMTLRLAVLTTVFGALAMALSSFEGLAQLGVLTIAGVIAAGIVTCWVLPAVAPEGFTPRLTPLAARLTAVPALRHGSRAALALTAAALAVIVWRHDRLWDDDLANLSPLSEQSKRLDRQLRTELGAADVRYLVLARGKDRESALRASEAASVWLRDAVARGWITGYEVASTYLPSQRTQAQRRAALPDAATLERNLRKATRDLPFREGLFTPFMEAVARARTHPPLDVSDYAGSALGLKMSALLGETPDGWIALAPLRGVTAPDQLAGAAHSAGHEFLDLKAESNALVNAYRSESLKLIGLGLVCIALQLAWGLRSIALAARVLAPVLAAVAVDIAILLLAGTRLSLFNLVALLLVVGVGLNYALFFQRRQHEDEQRRTYLSLLVCGSTTLAGFGCLAFSKTPVLHAIGVTVALGSILSLIFAAIWSDRLDADGRQPGL